MKAYITTRKTRNGYRADVITEQDYHECGYAAHSHRTPETDEPSQAEALAKRWIETRNYQLATLSDVASRKA